MEVKGVYWSDELWIIIVKGARE